MSDSLSRRIPALLLEHLASRLVRDGVRANVVTLN